MWNVQDTSPSEQAVATEMIKYYKECININVWFDLQLALLSELC